MSTHLHPDAKICGEPAMPLSKKLLWMTRSRAGRHPIYESQLIQGRGGERLSPAQLSALKSAGMIVEEHDKIWLTPRGNGLKSAQFTPLYRLEEALSALDSIKDRMSLLEVDGVRADDAWIYGSVLRGEPFVGDLDLIIKARTLPIEGVKVLPPGPFNSDNRKRTTAYREALVEGLNPDLMSGVAISDEQKHPGFKCMMIMKAGIPCSEPLDADDAILKSMCIPARADFDVDDPDHKYERIADTHPGPELF